MVRRFLVGAPSLRKRSWSSSADAIDRSEIAWLWCVMDPLLTPREIRTAAASRDISVAEMCRRAKIAESTFYRWEAGGDVRTEIYSRLKTAACGEEQAA